jgi:SAM-dependent methyltransferase
LKTNDAAVCNSRFKKSVVALYETRSIASLLKDMLHPGGIELTRRVLQGTQIDKESVVLDIACGNGEAISLLATEFGCRGFGLDLSKQKIASARTRTGSRKDGNSSFFLVSDAEELPFVDGAFDVVLSECSFSVLPDKNRAASEIARVLKPGGTFLMTDIVARTPDNGTVSGLPGNVGGFTLPCMAGAAPLAEYMEIFGRCGLGEAFVEDHSKELKKVGYQIGITFGGWREFLQAVASDLNFGAPGIEGSCCTAQEAGMSTGGKFGYVLIRMAKPAARPAEDDKA